MRGAAGAWFEHEAPVAIRAIDLALAFHVQPDPRVAKRAAAAVAAHGFALDLDCLGGVQVGDSRFGGFQGLVLRVLQADESNRRRSPS